MDEARRKEIPFHEARKRSWRLQDRSGQLVFLRVNFKGLTLWVQGTIYAFNVGTANATAFFAPTIITVSHRASHFGRIKG